MLAAAGRAVATRSGLLMSGEKSMPTWELHHLGAEEVACEAVRLVALKRGEESVTGGR